MRYLLLLAAATVLTPQMAGAQAMPGRDIRTPPAAEPPVRDEDPHQAMGHGTRTEAPIDHPAKDHAAMGHDAMGHAMPNMDMPGMAGSSMKGMLGPYPMTRDASGTAWQPDSSPMLAIMGRLGDWSTMFHGFATLAYDDQGGPRGDDKTFVASMLMAVGQRDLGGGTLTLKAMGSLDPLMGRNGYPLLLATGETADGRTELVDRQHPHDAAMELSATYSRPLAPGVSAFVYVGLPGEPALGPATYMHRFSGMASPEAPIGHHWLDATHVTFGVATIGVTTDTLKLETSLFTGREPDEKRWNIERPRFDSWSVRGSWNPTSNLSMQVSHGFLHSPEGLHPEEDVHRTTASITHNLPLGTRRNWQTTLAWGRNDPSGGDHAHATNAFLLDSAIQLGRWTMFGRAENVDKDELFAEDDALGGRVFTVSKLSLGGYHSLPVGPLAFDLGGLVSKYALPTAIEPAYGSNPTSYLLFARVRIVG